MYTIEDLDIYIKLNGKFMDANDIIRMVNYFVQDALDRDKDKMDAEGYVDE